MTITEEMIDFFKARTTKHIECVRKNIDYLATFNPDIEKQLLKRKAIHDLSKWVEPEYTPYVYITWKYKCEADGEKYEIPEGIDDTKATEHHVNVNSHHPEYWAEGIAKINPDNRDEIPDEMVDATEMDQVSLAEMVCDWHAVSLEKSSYKGTKEWADNNINTRWKFTDEQVEKIYLYIEQLEGQKVFKESFKRHFNNI